MALLHPRFIHDNRHYKAARYTKGLNGWTARISPSPEPGKVQLQVAACSLLDQFVKAEGRRIASEKPPVEIPVAELPKELAKMHYYMWYGKRKASREDVNEYAWILKYFI
jgi:hypothetical protein